jgi:hypothetical protein
METANVQDEIKMPFERIRPNDVPADEICLETGGVDFPVCQPDGEPRKINACDFPAQFSHGDRVGSRSTPEVEGSSGFVVGEKI